MALTIRPIGAIQPTVSRRFGHANLAAVARGITSMSEVGSAPGRYRLRYRSRGRRIIEVTLEVRLAIRMPVWTQSR